MKKHTISILLIFLALFSCQNQNSKSKEITDSTQINSIQKEEIEETDFDTFFAKYRSDSVFQINNTKFPLKSFYQDETGDSAINYIQKKGWKFNNFQDNRKTEYDQYEYVKEIINPKSVFYTMRGIDNGISVMYKFTFNNQKWLLEEIEDASN